MPPRREPLGLRLSGSRDERALAAVALYADRIRLFDIVEICAVNTHLIHREVRRAGYPIRDHKGGARALAPMVHDARLLTFDRLDEWRASEGVSARTAAVVWTLAHGAASTAYAMNSAPSSQLRRRCYSCGGISTDPLECALCHRER